MSSGPLVWSLRADVRAPASARAVLNDDRFDGLQPSVRDTLALLLSEVVTNSVRHAGLTADDEIELTIADGDPIRVEVRDSGPGFDVATLGVRAGDSGGFGLVLIDRLASRWGISGARPACAWFELDLDLERGEARSDLTSHGV